MAKWRAIAAGIFLLLGPPPLRGSPFRRVGNPGAEGAVKLSQAFCIIFGIFVKFGDPRAAPPPALAQGVLKRRFVCSARGKGVEWSGMQRMRSGRCLAAILALRSAAFELASAHWVLPGGMA